MFKYLKAGLAGAVAAVSLGTAVPAAAACSEKWICLDIDVIGIEARVCVKLTICDIGDDMETKGG